MFTHKERIRTFSTCLVIGFLISFPLSASAKPGKGVPFQDLQDQLDNQLDGAENRIGVRCDGQTPVISQALAELPPGGDAIIEVTNDVSGFGDAQVLVPCRENIVIRRDRVTLIGVNPSGDGAFLEGLNPDEPVVQVSGAEGARLQNLLIKGIPDGGSGDGVLVSSGSALELFNTVISGVPEPAGPPQIPPLPPPPDFTLSGSGVNVIENSHADIRNSIIEGVGGSGVQAFLSSSVVLHGNIIAANGAYGVFINEGSAGRIEDGNTIESDAPNFGVGAVVGVYRSSSLRVRGNNTFHNNAPSPPSLNSGDSAMAFDVEMGSVVRQDGGQATIIGGVYSFNLATVDIRGATITGQIYSEGLAPGAESTNVRLRNTTVDGNLYAFGALMNVRNGVTVNGDVFANDAGLRIGGGSVVNGNVFPDDANLNVFGNVAGRIDCAGRDIDYSGTLPPDRFLSCPVDLRLDVFVNPGAGRIGDSFTYTIDIINQSNEIPADDVQLFTGTGGLGASGGVCNPCIIGRINPNQSATKTLVVTPSTGDPMQTGILNLDARVEMLNAPDTEPSNNRINTLVFVRPAVDPLFPPIP